jgi:hypothetical protein
MCVCDPCKKTPWCGRPGCEMPPQTPRVTHSSVIGAAVQAVAEMAAKENLSLRQLLDAEKKLYVFAKALDRAALALVYLSTRAEARDALADIASLLSAAQEGK